MLFQKMKPHRDRKYLDWLRGQPCVVTGDIGSGEPICEPAHIRWGTDGGTSMKPSDWYAVPLRWDLHRKFPTGSAADWLVLANEYPLFLRDLLLLDARTRYEAWKK